MKRVLALLLVILGSMATLTAQSTPPTPKLTKVNVVVVLSFNGTKAHPESQLILRDKDAASGGLWWWGVGVDPAQASLLPGDFTATVDDSSSAFHIIYFTLVNSAGVPMVAKYYLYQLAPCEALGDMDKGNSYGCFLPKKP